MVVLRDVCVCVLEGFIVGVLGCDARHMKIDPFLSKQSAQNSPSTRPSVCVCVCLSRLSIHKTHAREYLVQLIRQMGQFIVFLGNGS